MGCATSLNSKNTVVRHRVTVSATFKKVSIGVSNETKVILCQSWKRLEQNKTTTGKRVFKRLLQLNPNLQDTFPSFRGVALEDLMNSRSLFLHSQRLMAVVENAVTSLYDAQEFIENLRRLGERHLAMSVTEKHLKVMEEAFILTLTDILDEGCDEKVAQAWRELFGFMARTMLKGLGPSKGTKHCEHNLPPVG